MHFTTLTSMVDEMHQWLNAPVARWLKNNRKPVRSISLHRWVAQDGQFNPGISNYCRLVRPQSLRAFQECSRGKENGKTTGVWKQIRMNRPPWWKMWSQGFQGQSRIFFPPSFQSYPERFAKSLPGFFHPFWLWKCDLCKCNIPHPDDIEEATQTSAKHFHSMKQSELLKHRTFPLHWLAKKWKQTNMSVFMWFWPDEKECVWGADRSAVSAPSQTWKSHQKKWVSVEITQTLKFETKLLIIKIINPIKMWIRSTKPANDSSHSFYAAVNMKTYQTSERWGSPLKSSELCGTFWGAV